MSGPSITSWNRLEPRPRSDSITRSLAAQVRDPLWILTRQWQFGEFQGQDAASPAWVQFQARFSEINGWTAPGGATGSYARAAAPLEAVTQNEPFTPNDAIAVELGQRFETLLAGSFAAAPGTLPVTLAELVQQFRSAWPLGTRQIDGTDQQAQRFRRVCMGRVIDGCTLYEATRNTDTPPVPPIAAAAVLNVVRNTVQRWRGWVQRTLGDIARTDAPAWQPERLEYALQVAAETPTGGSATLDAHPSRDGAFEWYAFDERASSTGEQLPQQFTRNLLPIGVQFRGMPHARWWQFQDRIADVGEIQSEIRELAKMVLMDFMFVHSNDWFVVPFTQAVGTLCRIDRLLVHDVFGGRTLIDRADRQEPDIDDPTRRWSMFATTAPSMPGGLADYFLLPPSAGTATLSGATIESIRFIRDEMANMAWAIESTTENGIGKPWLGRERTRAGQPLAQSPATAPLQYRIQSTVPEHWIPFVPVRISGNGQVALERAALLRPADEANGEPQPILPVGRVLDQPDPYRVREEEISRAGVTLSRTIRRTRWIDGSTHLWIARRKQAGRGEGSSGLRFDVADH